MKLIVGLGNFGRKYIGTRHNVGFACLDFFASKNNLSFKESFKFKSLLCLFKYNDENIILCKPLTYMNLSGEAVRKVVDYYKIDIDDLLVIEDDKDLTLGSIRLRESGGSGGHNGLKNIILHLGENFKRLKIGIKNDLPIDAKDLVLSKFNDDEKIVMNESVTKVSDIIDDFISGESFLKIMSKYNLTK